VPPSPPDAWGSVDSQVPSAGARRSQKGWLPLTRARRPPPAAGGYAFAVACGGSGGGNGAGDRPVPCSLPDGPGSQPWSPARSGGSLPRSPQPAELGLGSGMADAAEAGAVVVLSATDSDGELPGGGLAADFSDDSGDDFGEDEAPLAEFHWASQARSSLSQPTPMRAGRLGKRRRSSISDAAAPHRRQDSLDEAGWDGYAQQQCVLSTATSSLWDCCISSAAVSIHMLHFCHHSCLSSRTCSQADRLLPSCLPRTS